MRLRLLAAGASLLVTTSAHAASIGNDSFTFSSDDSAIVANVVARSEAGLCDVDGGSGCGGGIAGTTDYYVDWIDEDTFDIGIGFDPFDTVFFLLDDLDFTEGGKAANIVRVDFRSNGPHSEFLADPDFNPEGIQGFVDPVVGFSPNSVTINFFGLAAFGGDGPLFRFDVRAEAENGGAGTPVVPLPAAGWLLMGALGSLAALRRKG